MSSDPPIAEFHTVCKVSGETVASLNSGIFDAQKNVKDTKSTQQFLESYNGILVETYNSSVEGA